MKTYFGLLGQKYQKTAIVRESVGVREKRVIFMTERNIAVKTSCNLQPFIQITGITYIYV